MPRPKRTRVAATRTTKRASPVPEDQQSSATPPDAFKPGGAQIAFPGSDIYDVSDREKERIQQRVEAAQARATQHLDMNSDQASALEGSRCRRDDAINRLDDLTSTSRPDEAESPDIEHSRRESAVERQPRLTDASGLDLDDDFFGNLDDSLDVTENAIEETQTGYRSTDTSSFNVAMFKRRPRQSSVARRDDGPIRPSSRGQATPSISTTLTFGNFRRRERAPSILGTARKARAERSLSRASQASRNASVLGDGDQSGPEGESTPLDRTRRQTRASLVATGSREGSPVLPSRKRKSLESHEDGREKRLAADSEVVEGEAKESEEIHQSIEVEVEVEVERTPSPARGRARERDRFSTPVQEDDPDMAPPLSSSSESGSPAALPPLDTLAHRTYTRRPPARALKTPEVDDLSSEISSPPSLTHSPNYAAASKPVAKKKADPPQKKVTTADLTSLLPRRRGKASNRTTDSNDPFDLDDSEDERNDVVEDEPSYVDSRAARRRKGQQPLSKSTSNRKGKGKEVEGGAGVGKKRTLRTYGSLNEDKENEEAEETIVVGSGGDEDQDEAEEQGQELPEAETSQMMTERLGEELQKAVKKFREVDKWELSFEEVTESSSPGPGPDAR
ncbi:hypothetical protein N658DRAFT_490777 [Parathielavia hyrcaniae]|uniref:Uncharacterized protein n=1 Tax=Parathielavia hyrcaniae TaxID=113614 RepID=A0AAN6QEW2_9PEZI|nr:hypothetical protein N658DRAFT_490777 [Parathielavia hyrcaniae]